MSEKMSDEQWLYEVTSPLNNKRLFILAFNITEAADKVGQRYKGRWMDGRGFAFKAIASVSELDVGTDDIF